MKSLVKRPGLLVLVTLFAGTTFGVLAAEAVRLKAELPISHRIVEKYQMQIGVNSLGDPVVRPEKFEECREVIRIPEHYGQLLTINPHGDASVLWFQDHRGVLRNAVIERVKEAPYLLERLHSTNLEIEVERVRPR